MGARPLNEQLDACVLVASTTWGDIHVHLPTSDAADAAGLIQQLGHWCRQTLPFVPVTDAAQLCGTHVKAIVGDMRLAPLGTEIEVPMALLQNLMPPLPLQGAAVQWPALQFQVQVATLEEAAVEPSHVQGGGMVLLPQAFHNPWVVSLQTQDGQCTLRGHLRLDSGVIELLDANGLDTDADVQSCQRNAPKNTHKEAPTEWKVNLTRRVMLDLPVAMGWRKGLRSVPVDYVCDQNLQSEFGLSAELLHTAYGLTLNCMVVPIMLGAALRIRPDA